MENGRIEHGFHAPENRVDSCKNNQADGADPEKINLLVEYHYILYIEYIFKNHASRVHGYSYFGKNIRDQGDNGKKRSGSGIIALLQKFGHGKNTAPGIKGNKKPAQHEDHPSLYLPVGHGHATLGSGASQPYQVLGTNV